jgi:hypothetical protein
VYSVVTGCAEHNRARSSAIVPGRIAKNNRTLKSDRNMSPVVLIGGGVVGWGWEKWDSIAEANQVQVAPKQ